MILTTRPLTDRAWIGTKPRKKSQFTTTWRDTLNLLEREVYALQSRGMDDPILMMDIGEGDLRIDGQVRANARPKSDAVAISFESTKGPLTFWSDRYDQTPWGNKMILWQHNVRAIALTLEALRTVERHGATRSDEQYVGFRQLAAAPAPTPQTSVEAWVTIARLAGYTDPGAAQVDEELKARFIRLARRAAHPDTGGSEEKWQRFTEALKVVRP
jgi:hypothetical protein